jgi:hypothetical protein
VLAVALTVLALLRIALPTRILLLLTRTRSAALLLLAGLLTRRRIGLVLIRHDEFSSGCCDQPHKQRASGAAGCRNNLSAE